MKTINRNIFRGAIGLVLVLISNGCTNLDEKLYDRITSENFLQTKDDVTRDFLRSFEHGYWSIHGEALFLCMRF
jgi:hypothetical protein